MELDTMSKKAAALTAILTLCSTLTYSAVIAWGVAHAPYADAFDLQRLTDRQLEADLWRYEEQIYTLEEQLINLNPDSPEAHRIERRIEKLLRLIERYEEDLGEY